MNVLFTSITFKNLAGSELVTKDQAEWFLDRGFDVDIFTLDDGDPLVSIADSRLRIIDPSCEDQLASHYSIVISRQWPLLEYLIFFKKLSIDRSYFESVSWRLPIDFYPYFYEHLTLCGYVSNRIKGVLDDLGYDTSASYYFPNNAARSFLECRKDLTCSEGASIPRSIAIVSNHPTEEILEFANMIVDSGQASVDAYGMHNEYQLITPDVLKEYDLVISVGKTVYSALAMGIPCYLYDETCTRGYVTAGNFAYNHANNMASSEEFERKSSADIWEDIKKGYAQAIEEAEEIRSLVAKDLIFEDLMDEFYEVLMSKPVMDLSEMRTAYPYAAALSPTYVNETYFNKGEIMRWYNEAMRLGKMVQESMGAQEKYDNIVNSKSWRLVQKLRKLMFWK